ncbi:hypothetical protein [Rhizobium bangladeshense]|uniref:hypothetical protein n=1 Tax=Rhizobium bangladeshense TaxID=1138189 RepID=UPI0007E53B2A|nr:hypothetical protein [Rhizobium bangladeshense]
MVGPAGHRHGVLFHRTIQGCWPPLPILRRVGFRTAEEIKEEHYVLKALRGDFEAKVATSSMPSCAPPRIREAAHDGNIYRSW